MEYYNMKEIMKNAKKAWDEEVAEKRAEKAEKAAKAGKPTTIETDLVTWTFNIWEKYGKRRVYINGNGGRTGRGYIDLETGKVVVTKNFYGGENSVAAAAELYMQA